MSRPLVGELHEHATAEARSENNKPDELSNDQAATKGANADADADADGVADADADGVADANADADADADADAVATLFCMSRRTQRRNLGRSARRRRKKWLEIQGAEQQQLMMLQPQEEEEEEQQPQVTYNVVAEPVWPIVAQLRQQLQQQQQQQQWQSPQDEAALQWQLGRVPGNAIAVVTRVADLKQKYQDALFLPPNNNGNGNPQAPVVLQLFPLAEREEHEKGGKKHGQKYKSRKRKRQRLPNNHKNSIDGQEQHQHDDGDGDSVARTMGTAATAVVEPFPTIYWLTHPLLKIWVSKLEVKGLGAELEKQLQQNKEWLQRMQRAHQAYGQERFSLLLKLQQQQQQQQQQQSSQWKVALQAAAGKGISGMVNPAAVKCLHAHLAHYLSGGPGSADNIIGQTVMDQVLLESQTAAHEYQLFKSSSSSSKLQQPQSDLHRCQSDDT